MLNGGLPVGGVPKQSTPHRAQLPNDRKAFIHQSSLSEHGLSIQPSHHLVLGHGREVIDVQTTGRQAWTNVLRDQPVIELWGDGEF